jgi:hypothetical protein
VLLDHLMKWQFQPERRSRSWRATIAVQRVEIAQHLADNPGLKTSIPEVLAHASNLVTRTLRESEPQPSSLCPWTFEQVADEQFWPEAA